MDDGEAQVVGARPPTVRDRRGDGPALGGESRDEQLEQGLADHGRARYRDLRDAVVGQQLRQLGHVVGEGGGYLLGHDVGAPSADHSESVAICLLMTIA